jgi:NDP-sugar pyrophosphorylase family protein
VSLPIAILTGGLATRLRPITEAIPKALVEVAGQPFAVHQVELLRRQGIDKVVWLVGYRAEQIEAALGDGSRWGIRFEYVHDGPVPLGTGGAVRQGLPRLGEAFYVMYGDSYLECDFATVEHTFVESGRLGLMTVYHNGGLFDASNVEFRDGRIVRYDKETRTPGMQHIDWGLGVLKASALTSYPPGQPLDLSRVYQDLLAANELVGFEVSNRFFEVGSQQGLAETDAYLRNKTR